MAAIDTNVAPAEGAVKPNFIIRMIDAIDRWNQTRKTFYQLSNMSNRELLDIGIERADIYDIAVASANKPRR